LGPNWAFIISRYGLAIAVLLLLYLSQRFWMAGAWRLAGRVGRPRLRALLRGGIYLWLVLVCCALAIGIIGTRHRLFAHSSALAVLAGLWFSSAFMAYLAVKMVAGLQRVWIWLHRRWVVAPASITSNERVRVAVDVEGADAPIDPARRHFFQTAMFVACAIPFVGAAYGFAAERLRYRVERIEVPVPGLDPLLDGLRIAQLSDIHIGGYMPPDQVRRAVEMANELGPEIAVVTGDFITGANDPLEDCIAELARLRAPLGVWGCNGNHEIYAGAEDEAAQLFRSAGMRLLRQERAEVRWRGQPLNLIGVDYQRQRTPGGHRLQMLRGVEKLVRRDAPNVLLSHNPNAFPRAAELGIELMLAGHTHGGQVQVEILDRQWSPARFITPFVAGLYRRPLGAAAASEESNGPSVQVAPNIIPSHLYVNRGLGTIGAPVRIGVPPEITLLVLRRA
jgi:predicted MPP superfamily phosphohydrolase